MSEAYHRDPTFDAACRVEAAEKGCAACERRVALRSGELLCGVGRRFPFCRGQQPGFVMDSGGDCANFSF